MQDTQTLDRLFAFLRAGVTPWHAVAEAARWLEEAGYTKLEETDYSGPSRLRRRLQGLRDDRSGTGKGRACLYG